jgi:uncharacterized membrane protein SirB2
MTYVFLRQLHTILAILAIAGFIVRGYWMLTASERLQQRVVRIAPHVLDTLFLLSGIAMLVAISLNPFLESWLLAKFAGLALYILLGMLALTHGRTLRLRAIAFIGALSAFTYVVGVALSKSPVSWIAYIA